MSELVPLKATARPRAGKGAARQARRDGNVPAVIYGDNQTPETINLEYNELWKQVLKGHFTSTAIELDVEGKKHIVLARDVQVCPVRDTPLHVDFQRVGKDGIIRVAVPVKFINETASPGLKRGGVLNIVRHELELICDADKMPDDIQIDVTGYDVGDSIHISAVTLPKGSESAITDRDFTIATIVAPLAMKSTAGDTTTDEGEAAAEGDDEA